MLAFEVTSKPELGFEQKQLRGTTEKELGLKISFMYWDSKDSVILPGLRNHIIQHT